FHFRGDSIMHDYTLSGSAVTEILIAANELKAFPTVVVMDRTVPFINWHHICHYYILIIGKYTNNTILNTLFKKKGVSDIEELQLNR
ncbi:hypothetical protein ACJX0J_019026, partial [Zea mays]